MARLTLFVPILLLLAACGGGSGSAGLPGLVPVQPLTVSTQSLPDAYINTSYNASITAVGGKAPYSWTLSAGTLPTGLNLTPSGLTATIAGTPIVDGVFQFTARVSDATGEATRNFTLTVHASPPPPPPPPVPGFDFNGDGFDDVIVGAGKSTLAGIDSGTVFIFFGSASGVGTMSAANADVIITGGAPGDYFGCSVASAGDFNGDGFTDLIVGAFAADTNGQESGCVYIFFGSANPPATISANNADVKLSGAQAGHEVGRSVAGVGDFNGDGFDDIIYSASQAIHATSSPHPTGQGYIFFGSASPASNLTAIYADVTLNGPSVGSNFGFSVSGAGDFNGDGFADVIVGAHLDDANGANSGAAFIYFGSAAPAATIPATGADVAFSGFAAGDSFGRSVAGIGDVNGDGFDDIVVGASMANHGAGQYSGAAYVFYGSATPASTMAAASANLRIEGTADWHLLGYASSGLGDVNGDGYDDFIVGARWGNVGAGNNSGSAYVIFGGPAMPVLISAANANVVLGGRVAGGEFGQSVSAAGDFNGDGFKDIMVGAYYDNISGEQSGAAFLFKGGPAMPGAIGASNADVLFESNAAWGWFGIGVGGK